MSNCRTACLSKDHETYGDCLQASGVQMNTGDAGSSRVMPAKKWDGELNAYRAARAQGIQPSGTSMRKIEAAVKASQIMGQAYNSERMPPASTIDKTSAAGLASIGMI